MRSARGDVRGHIILLKNDCGPSYRPRRALQWPRRLNICFCEIFTDVRFSTFATVSANTGHTGPCRCMSADGGILLNQKRLCVDLVHEDERNSMRCFVFYGADNPCVPVSPSARLPSVFTRTDGGCDHATGQASFEAETHNQSRCREGAGCRRTRSVAGGWCIRICGAHCRYPAI